MKRLALPLILVAMALLLSVAFAVDCVRLAADARRRTVLADEEMKKHETRLITLLRASPKVSPEVEVALAAYREAPDNDARRAAYERLVANFRQTMTTAVNPNDLLERKFMDEVAGAINRREFSERQYDEEAAVYQRFLGSRRGSVARFVSGDARADWKPSGEERGTRSEE